MSPHLRRALFLGLVGGLATTHIGLVGMIDSFERTSVIDGMVTLGSLMPVLIMILIGNLASATRRGEPALPPRDALSAGAVAGALTGLVLVVLTFAAEALPLTEMFINATTRLVGVLRYGFDPLLGTAVLIGGGAAAGAVGAAMRAFPGRLTRALVTAGLTTLAVALLEPFIAVLLRNLGLRFVEGFLYAAGLTPIGAVILFSLVLAGSMAWSARGGEVRARISSQPPDRLRIYKLIAMAVVLLILLLLPLVIGSRLADVLTRVGLFILLGLGLNIVVGFAGLLDLGYVAFYAVGAYSIGVLTSAASPAFAPGLPFFAALPVAVVITAIIGLMIGAPVLRLRGDYLAIVTLGFGEIARIIFLSAWTQPVFGGAQGIGSIPPAAPFERSPDSVYYPILFFCILAALAAASLANSRVGRAWNAMREDESVAEASGINTIKYKLLAFALGATFGGVAGAFFSAKIGTIFPASFDLLVSINALALIILGGMGSIAGVIVGAIVLVGLPELLREFAEYRLLIYGAVLVAMMLLRPEGLIPSRSRRAELHEREDAEDQFAEEVGEQTPTPAIT
ncbi:MAG TPA: leucine/isoleucine/valine transporter permease subunit [Methylomirabilota bacterium]|nr:leucine/isoleucine/valine transporter permease subunit [Methylomirabilota bacterium]